MGLSIVFGVKYAKKGGETGGNVTLHRFFLKKTGKSFGGSEKSITFAPAIERDALPSTEECCGNSSVGRARPCQGRGREFESRLPLRMRETSSRCNSAESRLPLSSPGGGIGRRARFRCVCREACRFESCSGHSFLLL